MEFFYKKTKVNYLVNGDAETCVLFLHGWGGSIKSFLGVGNQLEDLNYKLIYIDFPPFGESGEPSEAFELLDYVNIVNNLLEKLNVKKVSIVSHSFGGRVAILFSKLYTDKVDKLILVSSAGLYTKKRWLVRFKIKLNKFFRKLKIKTNMGSKDYKNLSPVMKQTFSKIVGYDLTLEAQAVEAETLLIYGDKDTETPLYLGQRFNSLIKNSELIVFEGCGHFAYLEQYFRFISIIKNFLKG